MNQLAVVLSLGVAAVTGGCGGDEGGGLYCCTYESRHSACGGGNWTPWVTEHYEFNLDDYVEGWTPERVCAKFSGADTECAGGCCIDTENRNNILSGGSCPAD